MLTFSLLPPANFLSPSSYHNQYHPPAISIKVPTFDHLNSRLVHQANVGQLHQAISTLDLMSQHGFNPDLSTFSLLLKSAIRTRDFNIGKLLHSRITDTGLALDSVTLNSLITLYSKSGDWRKATEIFDEMGGKTRNLVSWTAMISCFLINGMELKAIQMFVEMLGFGFCPNEFCLVAAVRACSNGEWARVGDIIHGFALKTGNFDNLCVGCALIDMYVKGFQDIDCAKKVFDKMTERNVVVWTLMITRFVQMGYPEQAIRLFLEMERSGCEPDCFTFTSVISACSDLEWFSFGKQLHSRVVWSRLMNNASVGCGLVEMYSKSGDHDSLSCARKIFDQILDHSVMSWTAMISAHAQSEGHEREAVELYIDMIKGLVTPNHFTFASIIKACGNLCDPRIGEQMYGQAVKLGHASDICVGNSLISMFSRSGAMEKARKAFDVQIEKNLVSYNAMVDGYVRNLNVDEAFELFCQIGNAKVRPNAYTFSSLLSGIASIGAGRKGEQIHGQIVKAGLESNQHICNALISMYSRCGNIEAALSVFNDMENRNIISWTAMITGFAKHGFARKALEMFDKMIHDGVKPNEVTFTAVLSACSHVGLVSEGWRHFDSMYRDYRVVPTMEHYACMVDLLGRSGFLVEAQELINSMPFMANALVWRSLLGACLVHGNTEIGEHAAKMVMEKDPDDPASYTLLSNLYASKGRWEDVRQTRKRMKEKNLQKEGGCSWIETENQLHKFFVGDTSHPQAKKIYEKLGDLIHEIKKMGYIPNTDFVLHDIEKEQKEKYVLQHSEKLAVVYGLISTPRLKPIRIFKNLRVCGDCHMAMKYFSKATEREIVVRDSNRFHHFRNGSCSCGDYW
ncbi:hypothetical protein SOVF_166890 [Spinacia oleracea]|uniref:Pentatricopeptide repeat-containing protein At3g49170, chloroplastic n=1 Tax=Spinacia oleracea TaxID=3562 RepID=A0A9R0J1I8_SPIOL|nr:pentatricopeptide repeat-containing protein At3g49170, chloroplastic [Spinacia oleracea]KNA07973.1 hypothetical protein SOVF_166890 [Spinacia oleracea]